MRIETFQVEDGSKGGLKVAIRGDSAYSGVLQGAFEGAQWYCPYDSFSSKFDYVLYVHKVTKNELVAFLAFCAEAVLLNSTLDECWAIDLHQVTPGSRTEVGELVYQAKTYKGSYDQGQKPGKRAPADELGKQMGQQFSRHPRLLRANRVVGVPANTAKEPHNLPEVLAEHVAKSLGSTHDPGLIAKTKPTEQMKDGVRDEDRLAEIRDAYEVSETIDGERIVLVDDLFMTGTTMAVLAQLLRDAGATEVLGVVATKTLRG